MWVCTFVLWEILAKIWGGFLPISDLYNMMLYGNQTDQIFFKPDSLSHVILNRSKVLSLDLSLNSHVTFNLIFASLASDSCNYSNRRARSLSPVNLRTFSDDNKYWSALFIILLLIIIYQFDASASMLTSVYMVHCIWHYFVVPNSVFCLVTSGLQMQVPRFKIEIIHPTFTWNYFYLFLLILSLSRSTPFTLL